MDINTFFIIYKNILKVYKIYIGQKVIFKKRDILFISILKELVIIKI